ncbi:MAG: hypothetical protein C0502_05375 [Opitutus sp.]|nr:hypothetical protein [Opitutus sp.]
MRKARSQRETEALTIDVKLDTGTPGAVYIQLRQGLKVARTVASQAWPLVAIDYARDGRVIGIEAVGHESFTLTALLRAAGVRSPNRLAQNARFLTGVAA